MHHCILKTAKSFEIGRALCIGLSLKLHTVCKFFIIESRLVIYAFFVESKIIIITTFFYVVWLYRHTVLRLHSQSLTGKETKAFIMHVFEKA